MRLLLVVSLGVAGVLARWGMGHAVKQVADTHFPLGTFLINMLGSFLIGVVFVIGIEKQGLPPWVTHAAMVGFLGGFTTFSAFSMETVTLLEQGHVARGLAYAVSSPVMGVLSTFCGLVMTRWWLAHV
jgi:CrcB protein